MEKRREHISGRLSLRHAQERESYRELVLEKLKLGNLSVGKVVYRSGGNSRVETLVVLGIILFVSAGVMYLLLS